MGGLSAVSHKELVARLRRLGFEGPYSGGRHPCMMKGERRITIPNVHGREIGIDLLIRILKQAGISHEVWNKAR